MALRWLERGGSLGARSRETIGHAETAAQLPPHHQDPFDRMLIAQAQPERLRLITADGSFDAYQVDTFNARL